MTQLRSHPPGTQSTQHSVTVKERWLNWHGLRYRVWERPVPGSLVPPLVLLHGFAACVEQWGRFIRDIGPDVPVYAIDRIGYGRASKPAEAPYGRDLYLGQLDHLRATYGWERVIPVGHSAGGLLGILWAAAHPEIVPAVFAIAPGATYPEDGIPAPIRRMIACCNRPAIVRAIFSLIACIPYRLLALASYADYAAIDPVTRRATLAALHAPGAMWSYSAPFRQPANFRFMPAQLAAACPVHLLRGGKDRIVSVAEMAQYARQFPHATMTTLEGGGHCVHEERSREVAAEVRALLALDGFLEGNAGEVWQTAPPLAAD
jgi:pimeloyl-ACP methyl ester carboxylesterase